MSTDRIEERTPLEIWESLTPTQRDVLCLAVETNGGARCHPSPSRALERKGLVWVSVAPYGGGAMPRPTDLGHAVAAAGKAGGR